MASGSDRRIASRPVDRASEHVARSDTPQPTAPSQTNEQCSPGPAVDSSSPGSGRRFASLSARIGTLVRAIQDNDEAGIKEAILRLSESRRVFAPLAFAVGAFVMLFNGLRLLVTNWRLRWLQILPAMWIWLAMFDLKAHVLHGKSFHVVRGPILIGPILLVIGITVGSFFLNAVFAFAVSRPGRPEVRPAVAQARKHLATILAFRCHRRRNACILDADRHALGAAMVRHLPGDRRGRDDGLLRGDSRAADRGHATQAVQTRQACDERGCWRRSARSCARRPMSSAVSASSCSDRAAWSSSSPASSSSRSESLCRPARPGRSGRSR